MKYMFDSVFLKEVQKLSNCGNREAMKAARKATAVLTEGLRKKDPLKKLQQTEHGESRIKHCIKYNLSNGYRLVTIQHKGVCTVIFVGDHEDCDAWLDGHRGLTLAINPSSKTLVGFNKVTDFMKEEGRPFPGTDFAEGKLYEKIGDRYFDVIANQLSHPQLKPFYRFESISQEDEILEACLRIEGEELRDVFFEVFMALRGGDVIAAKNIVLAYEKSLVLVEDATLEETMSLRSSDQYIELGDLEPGFIQNLLDTSSWYDWMLFLHPLQRQVIDMEMSGSGRLLGVSGSGKTCVLVHRALRLAKKYPGEKILLLTLNPSLANLINDLVSVLFKAKDETELLSVIEVKSFWQFCGELLSELAGKDKKSWPQKGKRNDKQVDIDNIWRGFYQLPTTGSTGDFSLFNLHQTLLARGIEPETYLRQEFDWVRSVLAKTKRENYMTIERTGRKVPILEEDRKRVLTGLDEWEEKMAEYATMDYLGLSSSLYEFLELLGPRYRCVLVDEVQDFGTIELELIRKVVGYQENDLFLTGDIAQQVYNKHHRLRQAGININPANYRQILKNYRNSREILEAANAVFTSNINPEDYRSEDFQILPPEYANFSSPKPFLRKADSLKQEVLSAVTYLTNVFKDEPKRKGCIAFCGYTLNTVANIAAQFGLPCLIGDTDVKEHQVVFSDLEQTKGFEFDHIIIVNCNEIVFPNPHLPQEEWFRELSKLYVAMTRAKRELIVSWSSNLSPVFRSSRALFNPDTWEEQIDQSFKAEIDLHPTGKQILERENYLKYKCPEFLFTPAAIGLSRDLQNKLIDLVAGVKSFDARGRQDGWKSMLDLAALVQSRNVDTPFMSSLFGPSIFMELQRFLNR